MKVASAELEQIAVKTAIGIDKEGLLSKAIREAVDAAKTTLSALKKHLEDLKEIGDGDKIGEVGGSQQGKAADESELNKVYKALKGIVGDS